MNSITALLRRPPIGPWDIADILVVSVLIYAVLKFIKGTRAVQMVTGALLLVAAFYGSRWSRLDTLNWLVRNVLGYMVFAIIVLFQSDIRRALAHLGRAPFFRYLTNDDSAEESIEELVVATSMLATHRIGAIIAIERLIGLRNYIEGGISLDAVLTYDLILSIFHPTSPLHDGAVIVQNDRVAAAACFLPSDRQSEAGQGAWLAAPRRDWPHEETTRSRSSCRKRRESCRLSSMARSSVDSRRAGSARG